MKISQQITDPLFGDVLYRARSTKMNVYYNTIINNMNCTGQGPILHAEHIRNAPYLIFVDELWICMRYTTGNLTVIIEPHWVCSAPMNVKSPNWSGKLLVWWSHHVIHLYLPLPTQSGGDHKSVAVIAVGTWNIYGNMNISGMHKTGPHCNTLSFHLTIQEIYTQFCTCQNVVLLYKKRIAANSVI